MDLDAPLEAETNLVERGRAYKLLLAHRKSELSYTNLHRNFKEELILMSKLPTRTNSGRRDLASLMHTSEGTQPVRTRASLCSSLVLGWTESSMPGRSLYSFAQATHQSVNDYLPGTLFSPGSQMVRQSSSASGGDRTEMPKTCWYLTEGTGAILLLEMGGSPRKKDKESFLLSFSFLS